MTTATTTAELPLAGSPPELAGLPSEASLAALARTLYGVLSASEAGFPLSGPRQDPATVGSARSPRVADPPGGPAPLSPEPWLAPELREVDLPDLSAGLPEGSLPPGWPAAMSTSPRYFIDGSAVQASAMAMPAGGVPLAGQTAVSPIASPGEALLRRVLDELASEQSTQARNTVSGDPQHFYFVGDSLGRGVPQADSSRFPAFDVQAVRRDFPILAERVNGRPLIWLDNAATTQKPRTVIERLVHFYEHENSNIHRAAHELAARATDAYEAARSKVARFLGAGTAEEIVFVRGATEAINLVARSWGTRNVREGDEIVVSLLEHHANIVPWQQLANETGARLRVIPVDDRGQILLEEYQRLLGDRTRLVAISQVSNALGTITPVREIIAMAHRVGARVLVDGAQSVSHMRVDVRALDADFFVFSGHKVFAPTGIGALYGRREVLEVMPPWQGGGNMIADVTFERTVFQGVPARFEAGTGNIADAVGLGAAIDYVERTGIENIARYEHQLLAYATRQVASVPGIRLIGTATEKASVLSFTLAGYRPEEVGTALNEEGIAVRAGHHCAQPILRRFGVEATVRASLAFYNTCAEVDVLVSVLRRLAADREKAVR
ncbi:family 2A encapsulin nanocompartment cargo protein cysteine desulfurase [Accumulibacter sp.]|uniref:family 2A encapsulin nanocompartment cargo protein cysteine desulfurase n=1 Tax=Accumulibacter sp. TaxID=2053492 RepID=UPI0025D3C292|nr:family 2A encapsulin nanocompartment cargo protein cysteine desulfurase [Accumulibacter sp.]MCM8626833.1 SufS family cysteine desulfurase [Accumulibacter sp.]